MGYALPGFRTKRQRSARKPRSQHRMPRLEPLEDRRLLSVDMSVAAPVLSTAAPVEPFAQFASAEELQQYLVQDALDRYRNLFGQPAHYWWPLDYAATIRGAGEVAATNSAAAPDHSDTNTQIAGVDEGDIVETDGEYLYVLGTDEVVIIDSWSSDASDALRVVSRVPLVGRPVAEYLQGNRLTVLSEVGGSYWITPSPTGPWLETAAKHPWSPPNLRITVLDVSNRETPQVVQSSELEGVSFESRAIGSHVYLAMRNSFVLPGPELVPVGEPSPTDSTNRAVLSGSMGLWYPMPVVQQYVYETQEQYLARVEGKVLDLALPNYSTYDSAGQLIESGLTVAATDIYRPGAVDNSNLMAIVVFDTVQDDPGPLSSIGIPTRYVDDVYVSPESIYLVQPNWSVGEVSTEILKLEYDPTGDHVALAAIGSVPGSVLNQFSVDEYDGALRVATTSGWGLEASSGVYVLSQKGQELAVIGKVDGLAPGEQIYSVRFQEDFAFLVTFRQTDPLWVIDLSTPETPQVVGELEIPGFSQYLHLVPGGYLIGIGRNADAATGLFQEPQVSLFDVIDRANPRLLDRFDIEVGRSGWLEAFRDHHAVAYYPDQQVLTLTVTSPGHSAQWGLVRLPVVGMPVSAAIVDYVPPESSLYVLKMDLPAGSGTEIREGKVRLLGEIIHDTPVRRTVRIGDLLYSISSDMVSVHKILEPDVEVARLYYGNRMSDVGPVDFELVEDVVLGPDDPWYAVEATHEGMLTAEAIAGGYARAHLSLYDEQFRPLADSTSQRLDVQVHAGEKYYLRVSAMTGQAAAVPFSLRLSNFAAQEGSAWTLAGTEADDHFVLDSRNGVVTVNGVRHSFLPGEVTSFTFDGRGGNDTYTLSAADAAIEIVDSGGADLLDFSLAGGPLDLDLSLSEGQVQQIGAGGNRLQLRGIFEHVLGTPFSDRILGNGADNRIRGGRGADLLMGGAGVDWLFGEAGDDRLSGGEGDDWLDGGTGRNWIYDYAAGDGLFDPSGQDRVYGDMQNNWVPRGRNRGRITDRTSELPVQQTMDAEVIDWILRTWTSTTGRRDRILGQQTLATQPWESP